MADSSALAEHLETEDDFAIEAGTVTVTTLNTCCCVVGSGILALPLATYGASVDIGLILVVGFALASAFGSFVITSAVETTGRFTIGGAAAACLVGPAHRRPLTMRELSGATLLYQVVHVLTELQLAANNLGTMVVMVKVLADALPSVVQQLFSLPHWLQHGALFWYLVPAIIFTGLSLPLRMSELLWTSLFGLGTAVLLALILVGKLLWYGIAAPSAVLWWSPSLAPSTWYAISVFSLAYAHQYAIPPYYHELHRRTVRRMMLAVNRSMLLIAGLYAIVGVAGYLYIGAAVANPAAGGNVLNNLPDADVPSIVARVGLIIHLFCVFPIMSILLRRLLHHALWHTLSWPHEIAKHPSLLIRLPEAVACVGTAVSIGYLTSGIAPVVQLVGTVTGSYFTFLLPGACGWVLFAPTKFPQEEENALIDFFREQVRPVLPTDKRSLFRGLSAVMFLIGAAFFVIGLAAI